jgi:hypothetical protein
MNMSMSETVIQRENLVLYSILALSLMNWRR